MIRQNYNNQVENLCASFQQTVVDILISKTEMAINFTKNKIPKINNVVVAGGVAANRSIKESLQIICHKNNLKLFSPPLFLCGDNAAMIAWACLQRYKMGYNGDMDSGVIVCEKNIKFTIFFFNEKI